MKGLLKNNFYAVISNVKIFSAFLLLLGIFAVMKDKDAASLIISYMLLAIIGFPVIGLLGLQRESAVTWGKHKLVAPVSRADIVKSYYFSYIMWMFIGMLFAGVVSGLSILFHGIPFDRNIDMLLSFVVGVSNSLFLGTIFFPLSCWEGNEYSSVFFVVSLVCAIGLFMGLVGLVNILFDPGTVGEILFVAGILILVSSVAFCFSYLLAVCIFKRKEY
ncbi:MAG: ABC-2 transporter permease [Clostridium sp.]|nr:ABC-2 transporter permease [Clostridium sp.]